MKLEIPEYVSILMKELNKHGYECFVVGGAIRSILLNKPVNDYDLTTSALPEETKHVFHAYHTIDTGLKHGTVTVVSKHIPVEITTYRKDAEYKDHRHPDEVIFTRTIKEDCARRDFTINALCYCEETGILDFFNGKEDIERKKLQRRRTSRSGSAAGESARRERTSRPKEEGTRKKPQQTTGWRTEEKGRTQQSKRRTGASEGSTGRKKRIQ